MRPLGGNGWRVNNEVLKIGASICLFCRRDHLLCGIHFGIGTSGDYVGVP